VIDGRYGTVPQPISIIAVYILLHDDDDVDNKRDASLVTDDLERLGCDLSQSDDNQPIE
jgi:hypothetical protein